MSFCARLLETEAGAEPDSPASSLSADPVAWDGHPLTPGERVRVEVPLRAQLGTVQAMQARSPAFLWLDPPRSELLTWHALQTLLAEPRTTLLLRFPLGELRQQDGFRAPLADLPHWVRDRVEGCSALLGDRRHRWLARWRAAPSAEAAEAALLAGFLAQLTAAAPGRLVKGLRAHAAGGEEVCLFLVTCLPEVAMAMSEALRAAGASSEALDAAQAPSRRSTRRGAAAAVIDLFAMGDAAAHYAPPRAPGGAAVARLLLGRFRGRTLDWGGVMQAMAAGDFTAAELRSGMMRLRREGWATFRSLKDEGSGIVFHPQPVRPFAAVKKADTRCDLFCTCPRCQGEGQ